ncbi:hypothetical protein [Gaetbulibacter saemankumensis]|uniref:hypothetical protein n=1 Tax=Gaetbulibacter saemankumensis TaxID=311208 RepID=UPI0004289CA2|nr:hypothetical protein [Gaetbulibacter saemankumensis]
MKIKYLLPLLFITLLSVSCSTDNTNTPHDETEGLLKIQDFSNGDYTIEVYSKSGLFYTGYNHISLRIKNLNTNKYLENANIEWMPVMQMPTMEHSCPKSEITKVENKQTIYEGYIIYQMTGMNGSGWSLTFNFTIDGVNHTIKDTINLIQSDLQNVTSFTGTDEVRYIIALVEPNQPVIGTNKIKAGLFEMESMMNFTEVTDYTIALDPRMPSMGNHTSPYNKDLSYNSTDRMYYGDLSLTMTGYWVLNLKLLNEENSVLKGEDITESNAKSSLYLEIEF